MTFLPPLPPNLSAKEGRSNLRANFLLLGVLEGSAASLTMGAILSLVDDDGDGDSDNSYRMEGGGE